MFLLVGKVCRICLRLSCKLKMDTGSKMGVKNWYRTFFWYRCSLATGNPSSVLRSILKSYENAANLQLENTGVSFLKFVAFKMTSFLVKTVLFLGCTRNMAFSHMKCGLRIGRPPNENLRHLSDPAVQKYCTCSKKSVVIVEWCSSCNYFVCRKFAVALSLQTTTSVVTWRAKIQLRTARHQQPRGSESEAHMEG